MVRLCLPLLLGGVGAFQHAARSAPRRDIAVDGIFDGVKDAFSQDVSIVDEDRITPFDRWLGIDVRDESAKAAQYAVPDDFVDSMDESNYVVARLTKPMGIVFEENDPSTGGVFIASLAAEGAAETDGSVRPGDQLVAVGADCVKGADFDRCLSAIQASAPTAEDRVKLIFFRGGPSNLYGNLGASDEWMAQFMETQAKEQ